MSQATWFITNSTVNPSLTLCNLVILVTCVVSWVGFTNRDFEDKGIFDPERILASKQYHRLLTPAFLHAGWGHLLLNMYSLYLFGNTVETYLSAAQFLLIYIGAVLGGNLLALYVHRHHEYRAYGASGGVCGIIFAYILLFPGATISLLFIPIPMPGWLFAIGYMIISFVGMKAHNRGGIGHDAHLGGAIVGLLITAGLQPESARENWKIFLIVLVAAILLLIYLWRNPLFLPVALFTSVFRRSHRAIGSAALPKHKREALRIDDVLDKIAKSGVESLTAEEKELLGEMSAKYRRRDDSQKPGSGLAI